MPPFFSHCARGLSEAMSQHVVNDIYLIYSDIVEEFGVNVKSGPVNKGEETGFTLKNKTPLIIRGKRESLLALSVIKMLQGLNVLVPQEFAFRRSVQEHTNVICKRFL